MKKTSISNKPVMKWNPKLCLKVRKKSSKIKNLPYLTYTERIFQEDRIKSLPEFEHYDLPQLTQDLS